MPQRITVRAGDTEPLELTIDAAGISNLDDLTEAVLFLRKEGEKTNHVDEGTLTVVDSATRKLEFDPVGEKEGGGDALDAAGTYRGYVRATWTDGDITRHPDGEDLVVTVFRTFE